MGVTLRQNQRDHFYNELTNLFPDRNLVQKYKTTFGNSYECSSPNSGRLWKVFKEECERLRILYRMQDIVAAYKFGYGKRQISWF
jgi:hypothetical protein